MKNVKRFVVLTLVFFAALGTVFAGGGGQKGNTGQNLNPAGKRVVNVLWLAGMNQTNVVRQIIEEEFSKAHPDISIVFSEVPNSEISNKAMMEATGKTGAYDVVMQNMTIPALTNINALEPLEDLIRRDKFPIDKMIDNGIFYKGHTYGLPIRGDVRVLHYNQQMFKDAGLDPEKPPTSMAQFQQYARTLTRNGKFGVNRWPSTDNFTSLLFQFGGDILNDRNEPVYNSEAGVKAMQLMIDQHKAGYTDPKSTSWSYSDEIAGYLSGGSAMFDAWPARYIDAGMPEKSKIVGQSRVAALPEGGALVSGWYLVMYNTVKDRDAAWEFMKYVVDAKTQKDVILRGGDCNPTHLDVLNDPELQAKYEVLRAISNCFDRTKIYCYSTQYETIRTHITEAIGQAVLAGMPAKQALDAAVKESRQALVDAGELK
jgi:ABC-type glycerol-3-phosphate transport system substrate-binding protein